MLTKQDVYYARAMFAATIVVLIVAVLALTAGSNP